MGRLVFNENHTALLRFVLKGAQCEPELVLMYCTFVTLKAQNSLTVQLDPDELDLHGEKKLFQA